MDRVTTGTLAEILELARLVSQAVISSVGDPVVTSAGRPGDPPAYIHRRVAVETAVGIITGADRVSAEDALALLRSHAYARGRLVDDAAHDLVTDVLTVAAFR